MRKHVVACALISATSWLVACGTDPIEAMSHPNDGGTGGSSTGSGVGGSGQAGSVLTSGVGGSGGSAVGGSGGTAGSVGGSSGTAGTPVVEAGPPVSKCDGKAKMALPFNIMSAYRAVAVIGTEATFAIATNPDCTTAYPMPEAGTDAGTADSADETLALALDDPDASDATTTDVSASDAATTDAAPVEAGPPPPACYEFHYDPGLCEAAQCWAGVIFTPGTMGVPPDAMAQTANGICIATGATMVEFMARATREGARIKFGSTREGVDQTEFWINITTQWAKYTVAIPNMEPYNESAANGGVWNGFSVVVEPQDHVGGTIISVKDMTWK